MLFADIVYNHNNGSIRSFLEDEFMPQDIQQRASEIAKQYAENSKKKLVETYRAKNIIISFQDLSKIFNDIQNRLPKIEKYSDEENISELSKLSRLNLYTFQQLANVTITLHGDIELFYHQELKKHVFHPALYVVINFRKISGVKQIFYNLSQADKLETIYKSIGLNFSVEERNNQLVLVGVWGEDGATINLGFQSEEDYNKVLKVINIKVPANPKLHSVNDEHAPLMSHTKVDLLPAEYTQKEHSAKFWGYPLTSKEYFIEKMNLYSELLSYVIITFSEFYSLNIENAAFELSDKRPDPFA